ncbi:haus augmin-like complex subunit 8 [Plakobranchus ocellatus]|uniref:Haus augmin-like complex subunit 8 n=1 Tax=Plakobranchus ocellatus TaxID=259542 RepID=A0AAV4ACG8_9GAST|nr:haus augmin-like complex subunit 8 [Plakobranchus ocellatus]
MEFSAKSKRSLYHPASDSSSVGLKRTRRPLVQGRLVSDSDTGISDLSVSRSPPTDLRSDTEQDPTLSPLRVVPQLTEKASPRPEPPSSCLDLSDVDLDIKETPSSHRRLAQSRPVMVYDASEPVTDSPHSCEMSLSVGVESSPARVVCHTPSRLRNSPRLAMSPLAVTVNMEPPEAAETDAPSRKTDPLSRTLFPDGDQGQNDTGDDDEEIQFKKMGSDSAMHISEQSRGIIEEILAHEIGNSNIEIISLHSQSNSPQVHRVPADNFSSNISSLSASAHRSKAQHGRDTKSSSRPETKFEDARDDVSSVSDTCSLYEYAKPRVSPADTESQADALSKPSNLCAEPQGSQTPVRIKQKKKAPRQVASRYMQSSLNRKENLKSNSSSNSTSGALPASTKPQSTKSNRSAPVGKLTHDRHSTQPHKSETKSSSTTAGRGKAGRGGTLKTGSTIRQAITRSNYSSANLGNDNQQQFTVKGEAVGGGTGTDRKTSTPTRDDTMFPTSYIDASAIQSASNMYINASTMHLDLTLKEECGINVTKDGQGKESGKMTRQASTFRGSGDGSEGQNVTQLDLDFAYTRYLQWQFLLGRSRQAFHNQQQQASAQLHGLWNLIQARRQQVAQMEADVSRLRNMVLLDQILDEVEPELSRLTASLPAVAADYSHVTAALDNTCHQLPVADIYLPPGGDTSREAMEERLSAAMSKAEQLLSAINNACKTANGKDIQQEISHYLTCLTAIEKTSRTTAEELQQCRQSLEEAHTLNTRLASLRVQDMQSTS